MTRQEIGALLEKQRAYYRSGVTIPVKFRVEQLKRLYAIVKKYQNEINDALTADLGKSHYEGFMCESGLALTEISYLIKHTKKFAKRKWKDNHPSIFFAFSSLFTPLYTKTPIKHKRRWAFFDSLKGVIQCWITPFLL